jgi:drug/metabolite transporter (DMT)-like permease
VQLLVIVVLCLPPTAAQGVGRLSGLALFAAAFTGIACSAVALSLQVWGQRRIPPSRTALILLLEPVFAGVAGYASGERLGALRLAGAAVILAGIAVAELAGRGAPVRPELEPKPF